MGHNTSGILIGGNFTISTPTNYQYSPSVAYDSMNQRFLGVWKENYDIYGQLISADSTLFGENFSISTAPNVQDYSSVAYDSVNQRFIVTWTDYRSVNRDIYGQLINADGTLFGGEITISTAPNDQEWPSVAYDSMNQRFLVVWMDYRTLNWGIYGQLISTTGILIGDNFTISTAYPYERGPSVAYDSSNQRFLIAWKDIRNPDDDIYGRLVLSGGIITANLPSGYTSIPYYAVLQALGGTLPYTWGIASGVLPPGLNLIPSTGEIYGMPSTIGVYSFTIKVTEAIGLSDTAPLTITINNLNQPPTVALTASPTTGIAPLQVTFTATASDPDGNIAQYRWDFNGDGITDLTTATGTTTFTYSTPGAYLAQVTAVDNLGATASAYAVVSVSSPPEPSNQPPVVTLIASPTSGSPPLYVTFTATASDSDGSIAQYRWDFTGAQNVTLTTLTGDASYTYTAPGVYLAQVTIVDDRGATAFASSIITVESFAVTERELGKWGCGCTQALSSPQAFFSTLVLAFLPLLYIVWRKKRVNRKTSLKLKNTMTVII